MASAQRSGSVPLWPAGGEGEEGGGGVREGVREREGKGAAVTINMHQSDGSMRYLTMQANPNSAVPLGGGGAIRLGRPPPPLLGSLPTSSSTSRALQSHPSVSTEETSLPPY